MSKELDNKLITAMEAYDRHYPDDSIAKIKQAFADEGYVYIGQWPKGTNSVIVYLNASPIPSMTGQEWYDRFEKELSDIGTMQYMELPTPNGQAVVGYPGYDVFNAAKRAAGLADD